jgi:hypothetical protein
MFFKSNLMMHHISYIPKQIFFDTHLVSEGLAVGVGFGAIGNSPAATFENAR